MNRPVPLLARTRHLLPSAHVVRLSSNAARMRENEEPEQLEVEGSVQQLLEQIEAAGREAESEGVSGSAKLFEDAEREEREMGVKKVKVRPSVEVDDSPVWTGDESVRDSVIRMLMDSHKPLRSTFRTPETKLHSLSLSTPLTPIHILPPSPTPIEFSDAIKKEQEIPAEDFMPWHAKYVRNDTSATTPQIFYGRFMQTTPTSSMTSLLDRPALPHDPKLRGKEKSRRRTQDRVMRVEGAREGALDYRLSGGGDGYQQKGASAAGGRVGGASGMRAWGGLVEDRIERARANGWFDNIPGRGKPIVSDADENNPHLDRSEYFMNRIVKRQGAKPPWIELLGELESAQNALRSSLLQSYSRALLRSLITSPYHTPDTLALLTVQDLEGMRVAEWERREGGYHKEAVRGLNDTLRRMNALAPSVVRRPLILLEDELSHIYRLAAPQVFSDLAERRSADWDKQNSNNSSSDEKKWGVGVREYKDTGAGEVKWEWGGWGDLGVMQALRRIFAMRREDRERGK